MAAVPATRAPLYARMRDHAGRTALYEAASLRNAGAVIRLLAIEGNGGSAAAEAMRIPDFMGVTPLELLRAWQADSAVGKGSALPEEVDQVLVGAGVLTSERASARPVRPGQVSLEYLSLIVERWQVHFSNGLWHWYSPRWPVRLTGSFLLAIIIFSYIGVFFSYNINTLL